MSDFAQIDRWLRDAPPKVLRFPVFTVDMPYRLLTEAAAKFGRTLHFDFDSGRIRLEKQRNLK